MFLEQLDITNFRNYDRLHLKLSKNINIFYGKNAQGKTNILESIYYLSLGKSYRIKDESQIVKYNKKTFKIEGTLNKDNYKSKYSIKYSNLNKKYYIDNNEYKRLYEYISHINVVTFTPEDLEILKGIPDIRRRYIDNELSQLYNLYYRVSLEYKKILKMRNDLLKEANIGKQIDMNYFNILTEYLIDKAVFIYRARFKYIKKLNEKIESIYKDIIKLNGFHINYKTQLKDEMFTNESIKKELTNLFKNSFKLEKESGSTLYGPHRDDYEFYVENNNLKYYGSQGQQKLAILTIKLAEILIFKSQTDNYPILLLDDLFSEFDREKINNILNYVNNEMQVIITATDIKNVSKKIKDDAKIFCVKNGIVTER